jgi:hypothetical protein
VIRSIPIGIECSLCARSDEIQKNFSHGKPAVMRAPKAESSFAQLRAPSHLRIQKSRRVTQQKSLSHRHFSQCADESRAVA